MNLTQMKAMVAAFHQRDPEDLKSGPVDLFLVAANNARKELEKFHDFEYARCSGTLLIDGVLGGSLKDVVIQPPDTFAGMKSVIDVSGLRLNGDFLPFSFTRVDIQLERNRSEFGLSHEAWPALRYPSDAQIENSVGNASIVQRGTQLYNFPLATQSTTPLEAYIEGYGWLKDYDETMLSDSEAEPQDFFVAHGFDFLQWSCVIELNYIYQTFVPRQEGNVGSPQNMKQEALKNLILWDSYLVDPNTTPQ